MTAYLLAHQNPNAPVRADGKRYWGYPTRNAAIRFIGIHTAENAVDLTPPDTGAENIARFLSRTDRPASYHEVGDSDSFVVLLPPDHTAFGARGGNSDGWHWSFATKAAQWPSTPQSWDDAALGIAAIRCARIAKAERIPPVLLTRDDWLRGDRGFVAHASIDPARRTDPGAGFPWSAFLQLVKDNLDGTQTGDDDMPKLIRTPDGKIYEVALGQRWHIPSPGVFAALGYDERKVEDVAADSFWMAWPLAGISGGLSRAQADRRYVVKGTEVTATFKVG